MQLLAVQFEEVDETVVVIERLETHKHRPACVGRVGYEDVLGCAAIQLVHEPGVNGAEGQVAFIVSTVHFGHILEHPEEFGARRVRGQREAAFCCELVGSRVRFEFADDGGGAGVGPDDCVVERFAGFGVPDYRCFALVCDADGFDLLYVVAFGRECFDGFLDTAGDGRNEFQRVMFVPAGIRVDLLEFDLV